MKHYEIVIDEMGLSIYPDYEGWDLGDYVEEYDYEYLRLPEEVNVFIWEKVVERFPDVEDTWEIYEVHDVHNEMPEELLEFVEELIDTHYGKVINKWARNEIESLSEHVKEVEKYKNNIETFYGVSKKD
jgi:hypothetical protein